jgi:hypothetical protein
MTKPETTLWCNKHGGELVPHPVRDALGRETGKTAMVCPQCEADKFWAFVGDRRAQPAPQAVEPDLVELVARAICHQANIDDGYGDSETLRLSIEQGMWRNYAAQARAAIEAYLHAARQANPKENADG